MQGGGIAEAYLRAVPQAHSRAPAPRKVGWSPSQTLLPCAAQRAQPRMKGANKAIPTVVTRASKHVRMHFCCLLQASRSVSKTKTAKSYHSTHSAVRCVVERPARNEQKKGGDASNTETKKPLLHEATTPPPPSPNDTQAVRAHTSPAHAGDVLLKLLRVALRYPLQEKVELFPQHDGIRHSSRRVWDVRWEHARRLLTLRHQEQRRAGLDRVYCISKPPAASHDAVW